MGGEGKGRWDAIVIGGGAAGLLCAGYAARRGLSVLVAEGRERPLMAAEGPAKAGGEDLRRVVELCKRRQCHR